MTKRELWYMIWAFKRQLSEVHTKIPADIAQALKRACAMSAGA